MPPRSGQKSGGAAFTAEQVMQHLERLLASTAFRSSKRCQRFLQFTVTQVLEGRASTLKERTLAGEVFDRGTSWDAGEDTIVRVGAREVRKRLAQYYASPEGAAEELRFELPLGSYVPEFLHKEPGAALAPTPSGPPALSPETVEAVPPLPISALVIAHPKGSKPRRRTVRWAIALGCLVLLAAALFWAWPTLRARQTSLYSAFWAPFFHSREPVLVAIAHPLVYSPSSRAYQLNARQFGASHIGTQGPLRLPPNELNGADFIPQPDQYLAFGDAVAASNLQMILAKNGTESHLRFASKVEFADLRDGPVVMIGAFSNRWTVEVTQRLRYHFGYDKQWVPAILDAQDPNVSWSISQKRDDGTSPEDYFLICRLTHAPSGNLIVIGAGVAQFGTEAAGRLLASPQLLNDTLRGLPPDWAQRNLELVLHARVIGNSPAAPDLIRAYSW